MNLLRELALQLVGMNVPYIWGGKSPLEGMDCSGVTQYMLQSFGIGPSGTMNAQSQFNYWSKNGLACTPQLGALVFFGASPLKINHVGFCISEKQMVEAAGGGSKIVTRLLAEKHDAMVKISPIHRRSDIQGIFLPDYSGAFLDGV